jgi:hypothetical protein
MSNPHPHSSKISQSSGGINATLFYFHCPVSFLGKVVGNNIDIEIYLVSDWSKVSSGGKFKQNYFPSLQKLPYF